MPLTLDAENTDGTLRHEISLALKLAARARTEQEALIVPNNLWVQLGGRISSSPYNNKARINIR